MLTDNPNDYEMTYTYAPARFPQRQHCFGIRGKVDTPNASACVSGYGMSRAAALRDLKSTIAMSIEYMPLKDILPGLYKARQSSAAFTAAYFPVQFDGAERADSVSRDPSDEAKEHAGNG